MKYDVVLVFHKTTNLMPFFEGKSEALTGYIRQDDPMCNERKARIEKRYSDPRNVRLLLLVRYDGPFTFCKIKCPINPLPVKGEFAAPSLNAVKYFLMDNGWAETEAIPDFMLD